MRRRGHGALFADDRDWHVGHQLQLPRQLEVEGRVDADVNVRVGEILADAVAVAGVEDLVEEGQPHRVLELRQHRRRRHVEGDHLEVVRREVHLIERGRGG